MAVAVSEMQHKALADMVVSLTEGLSSTHDERSNLKADLSELTLLVQWLEVDVGSFRLACPRRF